MTDPTDPEDNGAKTLLFQTALAPQTIRAHPDPHSFLIDTERRVRAGIAGELASTAKDVEWKQVLIGLSWQLLTAGPDPERPGIGATETPWAIGDPIPKGSVFVICRVRAQLRPEPANPARIPRPGAPA